MEESPLPTRGLPLMIRQYQQRKESGFSLIELIGVLAVLAILASLVAPNVIGRLKAAKRDAEEQNLGAIGRGVELYLRQNRTFPANLSALSPDYVPLPPSQLTTNTNGYDRYYYLQPNLSGFNNSTGISPGQLSDTRFLLISNLSRDETPSVTNDAEFESWWNTDEISTPNLKIHRGHVGHLFHLLSLSADGAGGSYSIHGTATNSAGGTLTLHTQYHITGTAVGLNEANTYTTPEIQFTLTNEAGYRFDPDCATGSKWRIIGSGCYSS